MIFNNKKDRETLVILGTGWGGFNLIRNINRKKYKLVVISPRNYFLFTTLLFGAATKSNPINATRYLIKDYLKVDDEFIIGSCTKIDFKNKKLVYKLKTNGEGGENSEYINLNFDKLVVSVGQTPNSQGIEGVYEYALFMNQLPDAKKLYKTVLNKFDEANSNREDQVKSDKLHFIVVGGGPTGVETIGELRDFVNNTMLTYYPHLKDKLQLSLFHRPDGVLTSFPSSLSKYTEDHLKKIGINLISDKSVKQIKEDYIILDDNSKINYGLLVWAAGNKSVPLIDNLKNEIKLEGGKLLVNGNLQLLDENDHVVDPNCFALGDCAMIKDDPVPSTAQVAGQQANYLIRALNRKSFNKPFKFNNFGNLAYLGNHAGVANLRGTDLAQVNLRGFLASLAWCGGYWIMSFNWKVLIYLPYYWIITGIYGKSLTPFYEDDTEFE